VSATASVWQGNWKWLARGRPISGNAAAPPKGKAFVKNQGPDGLALSRASSPEWPFQLGRYLYPELENAGAFRAAPF
jgi:hypothetical protein